MKKIFLLVEKGFLVLSLVLFTQGLVLLIYEMRTGRYSGNNSEGNIDSIIAFFIIYILTFFLVFLHWKKVVYALTKRKLLLLLLGLAIASVLWSSVPQVTLRRVAALFGSTMFGFYVGSRYTINEQFRLLLWSLGTAMVLSYLFALFLPSFGIHHSGSHAGLWRGIYTHKNTLGGNMGYGLLAFSILALWDSKHRSVGLAGSILVFTLMLLSGSVTSMLSYITVMAILPLYSILRWRYSLKLLVFIFVATVFSILTVFVWSGLPNLLAAFGRDLTLTGRTQLWNVVLEAIQKRPWLGYGFNSFWLGWDSGAAQVWTAVSWHPDYSHNGYLEVLLDLGLLGMFMFAIDFFRSFFRAVNLAATTKNAAGIFPLAFLTYFLPSNIADGSILRQNSFGWIVYISLTVAMNIQSAKVIPRAIAKSYR